MENKLDKLQLYVNRQLTIYGYNILLAWTLPWALFRFALTTLVSGAASISISIRSTTKAWLRKFIN